MFICSVESHVNQGPDGSLVVARGPAALQTEEPSTRHPDVVDRASERRTGPEPKALHLTLRVSEEEI